MVPPELNADEKKRGLTTSSPGFRNRIVRAGLAAAVKSRPAAFFTRGLEKRIITGNFDDDLKLCAEADWIIEVVAENLEIKRALLGELRRRGNQEQSSPRIRRGCPCGASPKACLKNGSSTGRARTSSIRRVT